jgi:hypothetical protein
MTRVRRLAGISVVAIVVLGVPSVGQARQASVRGLPDVREQSSSAALTRQDVRETTRTVLQRYEPSLAQVLKLDPTLLTNESFLARYPDLRALLASYPEVVRSPDYYLGYVSFPANGSELSPIDRQWNYIRIITEMISVGSVMAGIAFVLLWLVRHFLAHRRWLRSTRLQVEIHNRLMERLQTGEDVRHYLESAATARLLADNSSLSAGGTASPVSRILLAVQVGVVLASTGVGILMAKWYINPVDAASDTMVFFGIMGLALGLGFALSAAASFGLSRRFGLVIIPEAPPADPGRL